MDIPMLLLIVAILAPLVALGTAALLRGSTARLREAGHIWALVEHHAFVLLEDRTLDPEIGDLVEFIVHHAGSGRLTRAMVVNLLSPRKRRPNATDMLFSKLRPAQEKQFQHLLAAALFYDSLRTLFSGPVIRRLLYWLASTVNDTRTPVSRPQVAPVASIADRMCHAH